jgi:hypothetical protein
MTDGDGAINSSGGDSGSAPYADQEIGVPGFPQTTYGLPPFPRPGNDPQPGHANLLIGHRKPPPYKKPIPFFTPSSFIFFKSARLTLNITESDDFMFL